MRSGDGRVGFLNHTLEPSLSPTVTFSGCKAQSRTTKTFGTAPRRRVLREKGNSRTDPGLTSLTAVTWL